ncbi:MAG TPA: RNA polymerase sigma factor [Candidatus Goldiibacteriota bacterium]|nr:RNA polymerase sigma factor [Candidatus Goldiibacteriota bacterium]
MDEDIQLMLKVKAGDRQAFNVIVDKYSREIINYAYRFTGIKEDAEDIGQEVFVRVFNAAPGYTASAKFTTWLYRIAYNACVDYIRKRKHGGKVSSLDAVEGETEIQVPDPNNKPADELMLDAEESAGIRAALSLLPEKQRAALILKVYEDKSYAEIAEILGVSVASVESMIFRARTAMRQVLKKTEKNN